MGTDYGRHNEMDSKWTKLVSVPNRPCGAALVEALAAIDVSAYVESDTALLGEIAQCTVVVASDHLRRAQWFMAQGECTEEELDFLATGTLNPSADQ